MEALLTRPIAERGIDVSTVYRHGEIDSKYPTYIVSSTIFQSVFDCYSSEVMELMTKIYGFSKLKYNWDSYGASPVSSIAIRNALNFLKENSFISLPFYFAAPGINGEVMIEFKNEKKGAELYFNEDDSNELLIFENNETVLESNIENGYSHLIKFFNN